MTDNKSKDKQMQEKTKDIIKKTELKVQKESNKDNIVKTEKKEDKKPESKLEEKIEAAKSKDAKKQAKIIVKKEEGIANGINLSISKKHSMYICSFIKNKNIDAAIHDLENVMKYKIAVPFKGEIPHRKGMHSGRYPINASQVFISLLKGLKGNAVVNGFDLDRTIITEASASWASRPAKSQGRRAKRTHVILKAREIKDKEVIKQ